MDIGKIKKHADLAFEVAQAKRNALEKLQSRQLMAYQGRLFRADATTINLIAVLKRHRPAFHVLDVNDNPCFIEEPDHFLDMLIARNQETLNAYDQIHQEFANKRDK
jgi:hypothetical protein